MKILLKKLCLVAVGFIVVNAASCSNKTSITESQNLSFNTSNIETQDTNNTESETRLPPITAGQIELLTFEDAIALSDCAASAKYISYHDYGYYGEYEFKINEVLYGDIPEKTILVYFGKGEIIVNTINYTEGEDYILIMSRDDLIFYDHPRYKLVTDIFLPLKEIDKSTIYGKQIAEIVNSGKDTDEKKLIKDIQKQNDSKYKDQKEEEAKYSKYSKSDKLSDIVTEADLVLELKIDSLFVEGIYHNGNTYRCTISDVLKGGTFVRYEDGTILVVVFKNSVKIGESYIITLSKTEGSAIYTQSAKKGIIPIKDTKTIDEVKQILNQ